MDDATTRKIALRGTCQTSFVINNLFTSSTYIIKYIQSSILDVLRCLKHGVDRSGDQFGPMLLREVIVVRELHRDTSLVVLSERLRISYYLRLSKLNQ